MHMDLYAQNMSIHEFIGGVKLFLTIWGGQIFSTCLSRGQQFSAISLSYSLSLYLIILISSLLDL